ncbi:MAG: Eco57I restriction-modification methylase domain-containing protein [Gammaproteobacteria bacterium]
MNPPTLEEIKNALAECGRARDFAEAAKRFLGVLQYDSGLTHKLSGTPQDFIAQFQTTNPGTQGEESFVAAAQSVRILFQYTGDNIRQAGLLGVKFDKTDKSSFLFVAVELKARGYSRTQYAQFTREINKRFAMPAVVLFCLADSKKQCLTLAFAGRRPNKTNSDYDVLEKVSLLREIKCHDPHRGHVDILQSLSLGGRLEWIDDQRQTKNFDGLLAAWLDELDTDALNKRFYEDLLEWFKYAAETAKFPSPSQSPMKPEAHIIRLVNRILFIWFLKEKQLVCGDLFNENKIAPLLKNYGAADDDSYYRAVLQNLFFATLNTETGNRGFRPDDYKKRRYSPENRVFSFRRYKNLLADPNKLEEYLNKSPFVNGGLFDCLDDFIDAGGDNKGRVDCFTDHSEHRKLLHVPNFLFFGEKGLFAVLHKYKFTVEENTPVEQEVALDPELLGKIFEQLLNYLNRKAIGAYYTPRSVVDYMVHESLAAYYACKITAEHSEPPLEERLRGLLSVKTDYDNLPQCRKLGGGEILDFISATRKLRLLDPAVGSGAFPMGALTLITMALKRVNLDDAGGNYEIKLSLIQNSIFGVDKEPMAVQICRLRFFISLVIEQDKDDSQDNYGIRPLPNLEAKMISADSLIKISPPDLFRGVPDIKNLMAELQNIRRDFFAATDRAKKKEFIKKDKAKREELARILLDKKYGDAKRIAEWDLYDQTKSADWFDAEWMFGVQDGFDIVIGNPPYVDSENMVKNDADYRILISGMYSTAKGNWDLFVPFMEHGINLAHGGIFAFIVPNKLLSQPYAKNIRNVLAKKSIIEIRDYSHLKVFDAAVCPITVIGIGTPQCAGNGVKMTLMDTVHDVKFYNLIDATKFSVTPAWSIYFSCGDETDIINKINDTKTKALGKFANPATVADAYVIKEFLIDQEFCPNTKKLINSGMIDRYIGLWGKKNMTYIKGRYQFPRVLQSNITSLSQKRVEESESAKLIFANMTRCLESFLDSQGEYMAGKSTVIYMSSVHDLKVMLAVLNSKLLSFWYAKTFHATRMGVGLQITKRDLSQIPIPQIPEKEQGQLSDLAEKILAAKEANPAADTIKWEAEIDQMVYALYGLTEEEKEIIEKTP